MRRTRLRSSFGGRTAFAVIVAVLISNTAFSQTTASIVGVVTDDSGGLIPNCSVKVTNQLTGLTRDVRTGADGAYIATLLPPGTYSVEAEAPGFKKSIRDGISLSVQQNARVDLRLSLGSLTETVTVSGEALVVDTRQAAIGALMDSSRMLEIPLSGRSAAGLLVLIPTVTNVDPAALPTSQYIKVNVAGGRASANNFMLDNARWNSVMRGEGNPIPPPDMLTEFRVTNSSGDAEKGFAGSATVQVVTKSGTNTLHGTLWEFHRDNALTARNFFAATAPFLVQNQFGFVTGGPIFKDRTFFFGGYQGTRIRQAVLNTSAFPATELEKAGNFSKSAGGPPIDPNTNVPFPDGIIPSSRWDQAAVKYLSKLPGPNMPDGSYRDTRPRTEDGNQFLIKVDHILFKNDQISARYWYSN